MKKRVLIYVTVITSIFLLQSCVTNYTVSEPSIYHKGYKTDAKTSVAEINRLEKNKNTLINSFAAERNAKIAIANNLEKNAEIAKTIKLTRVIDRILSEAATYLGTPYRYGGMTRSGIDCSAFVLSVFESVAGIELPRVASAQAKEGDAIERYEIQKGDLLFFSQGRNRISHVGIVDEVSEDGEIKFIHSATSKGVMFSTLSDPYWGSKYRFAKRVLTTDSIDNIENLASNIK